MSCSERTLAGTIDALASFSPDQTWACYPTSSNAFSRGELRSVSFATFANAINRLAWHLESALPQREAFETITYVGPSDIRYFALVCAASKCRLKALFSSPRNNLESHLSLLEKTECNVLLQPRETPQDRTTQSILAKREMRCVEMPTLDELLDEQAVKVYPMIDKPWSELSKMPCLTLHTSGSTGLPKPIDISHGLLATIDAQQLLPDVDGRHVSAREWANRTVYTALPPFHSAGINFFGYSVFQSTKLVLGPCNQPPSVSTVEQVLDKELASAGVIAPSLLAEVAAEEALLSKLSRWSSVIFGGGPLAQEAGDKLWQQTKVLQILGSTETFNIPELVPRAVDEWAYHRYHPSLGIEFQDRGQGLAELVYSRRAEMLKHQGPFWTFPDLDEYPMKDLYEQHRSKPGLWANRGRLDDIIVLSNGEKVNPSGGERVIAQDPQVRSALIVGNAQTQPALLVEPAEIVEESNGGQTRASIMGAVRLANQALPGHAQIHDSHVHVLESPDAFLRSSKGEIRRAPTTEAFKNIIAELYKSAETSSGAGSKLDFSSQKALQYSVLANLTANFFEGRELQPEQDLFACGFDSLRAIKLLRCIKANLKELDLAPAANLTPRLIYQHPTAASLSTKLWEIVNGEGGKPDESDTSRESMQQLLDSYTARVDDLCSSAEQRNVVLLTGSTGSLGSYVLDSLIRSPSVSKVVCLNRAGSDASRQTKINESRGLSTIFFKVEFLEVDLAQNQLGLETSQYTKLLREGTHLIHNAWPVNFNLSLSSFESQLAACHRLTELANASTEKLEITFISSVGAANNWPKISDAPVPEALIENFDAPEQMGYGQSKLIAELQFAHACKKLNLPMTICRIGQVAGPVRSVDKGMWSLNEWFPSCLASCKTLGKVPDTLGAMDCMDWIPVDLLSEMLVEAVLCDRTDGQAAPMTEEPDSLDGISTATSSEEQHTRHSSQSSSVAGGHSRETSPRAVPSSRTSFSFMDELTPSKAHTTRYLHFVNPQKAQWRHVAADVAPMLGGDLKVVSYGEWLAALSSAAERDDSTSDIPAAKLLVFFREIGQKGARRPVFSCEAAKMASSKLRELPPVSMEWFKRWIAQWDAARASGSA